MVLPLDEDLLQGDEILSHNTESLKATPPVTGRHGLVLLHDPGGEASGSFKLFSGVCTVKLHSITLHHIFTVLVCAASRTLHSGPSTPLHMEADAHTQHQITLQNMCIVMGSGLTRCGRTHRRIAANAALQRALQHCGCTLDGKGRFLRVLGAWYTSWSTPAPNETAILACPCSAHTFWLPMPTSEGHLSRTARAHSL